ncbi:unnamed protein product [Acanthoscelides obtectus]|uniref:Uncharacterized protein n=1 Tax=Acanthoscelides obtectus TaxID=200917 RepID=A0A9P0JRH3_ACAOB|nr:unnamed protein product [Acanthoscelides obtectus]CAK1633993.1 hypothetical protein AOBTE_LOCUS8524 [Acanthoscelides obtectus]
MTWVERLAEYDFENDHRAGLSHRITDTLCWRPCPPECSYRSKLEETTLVNDSSLAYNNQEDHERDPDIKRLKQWKEDDPVPLGPVDLSGARR